MPEKSPFAEGNLGMQRYQVRHYMKRFVGGILNAKPSEDTSRWRQPAKNTPINNIALEEQRYLMQKRIAHENLILSQHIHDIKTENRKETTIEYADGWRIAKSGGNTRPVIDCYPTQRRIALNFHNLHSRKHTDEKMKKVRAYQDDRMNKNINRYRSEYNLKTLLKSYNKKKFLMTNMTNKIPRTVLHIGLKTEALRSLKRDKLLALGLRPPPIKPASPPVSPSKQVLELPKWNNSPVVDRRQSKDEHPAYPSSVELLGPLYGPIDMNKLSKVPASTIKLSSSLKLDREVPTLPQAQSLQGRPQSAGSTRPKIKAIDLKPESRPKSAITHERKKEEANNMNEDWNLYDKIPLQKVSKVTINNTIDTIEPISVALEDDEVDGTDGLEGLEGIDDDDDVDAFDQYLLDRYMAVIGETQTTENEYEDEKIESNIDVGLESGNVDIDQDISFLEYQNARRVVICESAIPAFAVIPDNEITVCRYIVRILDVGLLHTSHSRKKTVSTSTGVLIEVSPIIENDLIRDNVHSNCLPIKSDSPTKNELIESIQGEVQEQILREENAQEKSLSCLSCTALIRIAALKQMCLTFRKRNLVRALSSLKEIDEGLYECLSDCLDPPSVESLCGLLLSTIGIELHLLQQGGDGEESVDILNSNGGRVWAARISLLSP